MKRWMPGLLAVLVAALLLAGVAGAQTAPGLDLSWHAMANGGGRPASASFALYSTVGQGLAGYASAPGTGLEVGYWHGWADLMVYLPLVLRGF